MPKVNKFPKSVFVYWDKEGRDGEKYLLVDEDINKIVNVGEEKTVAIYELKGLKTIAGTVVIR